MKAQVTLNEHYENPYKVKKDTKTTPQQKVAECLSAKLSIEGVKINVEFKFDYIVIKVLNADGTPNLDASQKVAGALQTANVNGNKTNLLLNKLDKGESNIIIPPANIEAFISNYLGFNNNKGRSGAAVVDINISRFAALLRDIGTLQRAEHKEGNINRFNSGKSTLGVVVGRVAGQNKHDIISYRESYYKNGHSKNSGCLKGQEIFSLDDICQKIFQSNTGIKLDVIKEAVLKQIVSAKGKFNSPECDYMSEKNAYSAEDAYFSSEVADVLSKNALSSIKGNEQAFKEGSNIATEVLYKKEAGIAILSGDVSAIKSKFNELLQNHQQNNHDFTRAVIYGFLLQIDAFPQYKDIIPEEYRRFADYWKTGKHPAIDSSSALKTLEQIKQGKAITINTNVLPTNFWNVCNIAKNGTNGEKGRAFQGAAGFIASCFGKKIEQNEKEKISKEVIARLDGFKPNAMGNLEQVVNLMVALAKIHPISCSILGNRGDSFEKSDASLFSIFGSELLARDPNFVDRYKAEIGSIEEFKSHFAALVKASIANAHDTSAVEELDNDELPEAEKEVIKALKDSKESALLRSIISSDLLVAHEKKLDGWYNQDKSLLGARVNKEQVVSPLSSSAYLPAAADVARGAEAVAASSSPLSSSASVTASGWRSGAKPAAQRNSVIGRTAADAARVATDDKDSARRSQNFF